MKGSFPIHKYIHDVYKISLSQHTIHTQHTKRNHENNTPKRKGDNKMKQQVLDCFAKLFGGEGDIRTYFAPGRVNLLGEHTITTEATYFHVH